MLKAGPVVALGAVGLALWIVELGLHVFPLAAVEMHRRNGSASQHARFYRYDPELGWRGRPHAQGPFAGWEFSTDVALNDGGFREREVAERKPGRFRIVVLGDSISWGYGVEQGERYSDLVGRLLPARGIDVEVVNLSVSGYATDQESLLFRAEGARYCPDLVLLGLYENDLRENASAVQGPYPKPYFRTTEAGELALANSPVPKVPEWGADGASRPAEAGGLEALLRRHVRLYAAAALVKTKISARAGSPPPEPPVSPDQVERTARLVGRLAGEVERTGSGFLVVVLPELRLAASPAMAAARSGVAHVLDLTPVFRAAGRAGLPLFYRLDGAHWTRRAHALAAVAIAEFVASRRLLPPAPRSCAAAS